MDRKNNFDLLRLALAAGVFVFHFFVLGGFPSLYTLTSHFDFGIFVDSFFVISGFLIFQSYEGSRSLADYAEKRARRIYPAYLASISLCAVLGVALSSLPLADYFTAPGLYKYLAANLAFMNFLAPTLPGLFAGYESPAVNGALWTIKVEVMFYASVPLIVWLMRRGGRLRMIAAFYVASVIYRAVFDHLAGGAGAGAEGGGLYALLAKQLPGQLSYFMAGALFYYYLDEFLKRGHLYFAAGLAVYIAGQFIYLGPLIPLALGAVVIYLACGLPSLGNFGKYGDLSYGIYVWHFPVIQSLRSLGLYAHGPVVAFTVSLGAILLMALLSWHIVERPMLKRSSHYVQATGKGK